MKIEVFPERFLRILAAVPPTGRFLAVELKAQGGRLEPAQTAELERIRGAGGVAVVARCLGDVMSAIWAIRKFSCGSRKSGRWSMRSFNSQYLPTTSEGGAGHTLPQENCGIVMTNTKLKELVVSSPETCELLDVAPWTLEKYKRRGLLVPYTDRQRGGRSFIRGRRSRRSSANATRLRISGRNRGRGETGRGCGRGSKRRGVPHERATKRRPRGQTRGQRSFSEEASESLQRKPRSSTSF